MFFRAFSFQSFTTFRFSFILIKQPIRPSRAIRRNHCGERISANPTPSLRPRPPCKAYFFLATPLCKSRPFSGTLPSPRLRFIFSMIETAAVAAAIKIRNPTSATATRYSAIHCYAKGKAAWDRFSVSNLEQLSVQERASYGFSEMRSPHGSVRVIQ